MYDNSNILALPTSYGKEETVRAGRAFADAAATGLNVLEAMLRWTGSPLGLSIGGLGRMFERMAKNYQEPPLEFPTTVIDGKTVPVKQETVLSRPWGELVLFESQTPNKDKRPTVLLVTPMSGHGPHLLKDMIQTLIPHAKLYVAAWRNARDVPLSQGGFSLDDYVEEIKGYIHKIGPKSHVIAVCQPTPAVTAAIALMAQNGERDQPRSLTVMVGPGDTRINPTVVDKLATSHPIGWFENQLGVVPPGYKGVGQVVHEGRKQLAGFIAMNLEDHLHAQLMILKGDSSDNPAEQAAAKARTEYYDTFFAANDSPAQYFLDTIERVFQKHSLPKGEFVVNDQLVKPGAIRNTSLMTVEGGQDDVVGKGQTYALHGLLSSIPANMRGHYVVPDAGHFDVFSGATWEKKVFPRVWAAIEAAEARTHHIEAAPAKATPARKRHTEQAGQLLVPA